MNFTRKQRKLDRVWSGLGLVMTFHPKTCWSGPNLWFHRCEDENLERRRDLPRVSPLPTNSQEQPPPPQPTPQSVGTVSVAVGAGDY